MSGSQKFNRKYILKVEVSPSEYVEIVDPLTLEFTITRNNLAGANTAHFIIYNLAPKTRDRIYKDVWDLQTMHAVQLFAGYSENVRDLLPRCFNGTIKRAYSHRQGSEVRTEIEAYDSNIALTQGIVSAPMPAGSSKATIIKAITGSVIPDGVKNTTIGNKYQELMKRGVALFGNPMEIINQLTGNQAYIDDNHVYAMAPDEGITGDIRKIDASNGLIGTPKKSEKTIEIEMLFEPRIKPSQYIELKSITDPRYNGLYKVTGFSHRGTISGAVAGYATTTLQMVQEKEYHVIFDENTSEYRIAPV